MSTYVIPSAGDNLSGMLTALVAGDQAVMSLQRGASEPAVKPHGTMWWDTGDDAIKLRQADDTWLTLVNLSTPATLLNAAGTVPMGANLPMGGHKVTGLANGTNATDAAAVGQVMLRGGANAATGNMNLGGNRITNLGEPTNPADAARKADVDAIETGSVGKHVGTISAPTQILNFKPSSILFVVNSTSVGSADQIATVVASPSTGQEVTLASSGTRILFAKFNANSVQLDVDTVGSVAVNVAWVVLG